MHSYRKMIQNIVSVGAMFGVIILVFVLFIRENNKQILIQNADYIEDATKQTVERIEDILINAQGSIDAIAYLYGDTLKRPEVDSEQLKDLADNSPFRYIEFVDSKGSYKNDEGNVMDVSDRAYFKQGMLGNSGMDVIFDSRISEENLLVFYAPLKYQGEIIGVLTGLYSSEQIRDMLNTTIFGVEARTFLCMEDGSVISGSAKGVQPENIIGYFSNEGLLDEESFKAFSKAYENHEDYRFVYKGSEGTSSAYMVKMENCGWILLQTVPSKVTNEMVENVNAAGVRLEIELICIFVIYIVYLLLMNWRQKKKLISEKQQVTRIVDSIVNLFVRFVVFDFESDEYQYLEDNSLIVEDLPLKGDLSALRKVFSDKFIVEEGTEDMNRIVSTEYIQKNLTEDIPYLQYEYRIRRESEIRWENVTILSMRREQGVPVSVLLAVQDVTELKEEEARNREALRQAFLAAENANHAKSDFLSRMSHDIRTPMNAIMGMTAIAAMHTEDPARIKDCLDKITVSGRHLLGLINEVLDMSKIEGGKVNLTEEEFSLSELVDNVLTIFQPQIENKKQNLKVSVENVSHEEVVGDAMRLQQVFVNIMGNALKFTPEGGDISLTICEKTSHIVGSGSYEFIFEDSGIGMDEEFVKHIFEPFSRAKDSRVGKIEGTGLGMAIVRNIVRMMNGDIQVESEPGRGSKFTVSVFLKLNHEEQNETTELENIHVLVVDDEQYACESACAIISSIGMLPDWVLSGDEAVTKLLAAKESGDEYEVVILDWKMPEKDGLETAREIREKIGESIPIIILSAFDFSVIEEEAREVGVNAFISKPIFRSRLVYVMKQLMGQEETEEGKDSGEIEIKKDYSEKRVLLVEDNPLNMEIAEELLGITGISIDKAYDGKQAVERVHEMPENYYDLVFMDIQMPNMNGYEATAAIRSSERPDLKTLPIVAMSADAFADDVLHAKNVGMNDHISKPVNIARLFEVLEKWI